jgi:2-methylisocitrate lyase-like PEP mutase family enzyme
VVSWSGFLATNPEVRVRFPALRDVNSGYGTGPTQPLSTIEELLERKISGFGL